MKTEILKVNMSEPELQKMEHAANVIRQGGLVVFPTETVYGLGANAFDDKAVKKIFVAKGRPSDNPLIVHISKKGTGCSDNEQKCMLDTLISDPKEKAKPLMDAFWPGPLTIIFNKSQIVSDIVTAGLSTVAVRMPSHPIASMLLELSGLPIVAPSANASGRPSPTCIEHVIEDLYGKVDVIIDSGNVDIGIESTVLDISTQPAVILRPGAITFDQISSFIPDVQFKKDYSDLADIPKAPGMKYTHYSPKADVFVIQGDIYDIVEKINELSNIDAKVGILATKQTADMYQNGLIIVSGDRENPHTIAANLFSAFRQFDSEGVDVIFAEGIEEEGIGVAIMNRMRKAAGPHNIINVGGK